MSKATTAYTAAAKEDDYSRRNLANELSLRRDRHRALAQRFNSGSDTESFLIRERFSTAAERSRQRLDQIESRHIERLEAALLAAGNSNTNNSNNANDRQKLWDAWAEAEAYRDQDMQRVGLQNKRDTNNVVQWQQTQRRREQIFNELQGELRHFDNIQVSSPQHNYPHHLEEPRRNHQQDSSSSVLSPQSMRLVEQVRSLLNVHSDEVSHARASGASLAEQQILEERAHQQELLRLEQERREKEEQLRREETERQRQAQEEARKKWEQEQAENERKKAEAQKPIRMMGDWKELKNPETGTNYFLNVVTRKITTNVQETPFYVPMPVVATADPVLAQQKTNPATTTSSQSPQPQHQKPVQQKEEAKPTEQPQKAKQPVENTSGPKVGEIKGDWKVMLDKASGKIYFYNTVTKKTTWKIEETPFGSSSSSSAAAVASSSSSGSPKAGDVNGDWKAMLDKASGKIYFYNTATKKTTWKIEETTFASNTGASSPSSPKQSATTTTTSSASSSPQAGEVNGDWKSMLDKASGKIYFYNTATKKTTWKIEETTFATSSSKSSSSPAAAVGSPKEGEVKGDWKAMLDKASGKNYFYNTSTKKTTWKIEDTSFGAASASPASPTSSSSSSPQAGEVKGDWKAMLDKASGKIYFYNGTTKKTTWKIDETSFAQSSNNKSQTSTAPSSVALKAGDVKGDWKVMLDKASGKLYFYNTSTKKTTWKQSETPFAQSLDDVL